MIYYVEDDDVIRELVLYALSQTGMTAMGFASAEPFWHAMENETPRRLLLSGAFLPVTGRLDRCGWLP